jgi:hypothetical protein
MTLILIFGVPIVVAAALIAPISMHDIIRGLVLFSGISAVLLPIAGWPVLLTEFAFPGSGTSRLAAVARVWFCGSVVSGSIFTLLKAIFDYSPARPGPSPRIGFLIAEFTVCMLVSSGVFGPFVAIVPREILLRGAVISGFVLFLGVATLGFVLFG